MIETATTPQTAKEDDEGQVMHITLSQAESRQMRLHAAERGTSRRQLIAQVVREWLARNDKYAQ